MEIKTIRKYAYSIPFFIMAIGFFGMIKLNWFAVVPAIACVIFGVINYRTENKEKTK